MFQLYAVYFNVNAICKTVVSNLMLTSWRIFRFHDYKVISFIYHHSRFIRGYFISCIFLLSVHIVLCASVFCWFLLPTLNKTIFYSILFSLSFSILFYPIVRSWCLVVEVWEKICQWLLWFGEDVIFGWQVQLTTLGFMFNSVFPSEGKHV